MAFLFKYKLVGVLWEASWHGVNMNYQKTYNIVSALAIVTLLFFALQSNQMLSGPSYGTAQYESEVSLGQLRENGEVELDGDVPTAIQQAYLLGRQHQLEEDMVLIEEERCIRFFLSLEEGQVLDEAQQEQQQECFELIGE